MGPAVVSITVKSAEATGVSVLSRRMTYRFPAGVFGSIVRLLVMRHLFGFCCVVEIPLPVIMNV